MTTDIKDFGLARNARRLVLQQSEAYKDESNGIAQAVATTEGRYIVRRPYVDAIENQCAEAVVITNDYTVARATANLHDGDMVDRLNWRNKF